MARRKEGPAQPLAVASLEWAGGGIGAAVSAIATELELFAEVRRIQTFFPRYGFPWRPGPTARSINAYRHAACQTWRTSAVLLGSWLAVLPFGARAITRGRPTIVMVHGAELGVLESGGRGRGVATQVLRSAHAVVAPSEYTKSRLLAVLDDVDCRVVRHGVDSARFAGVDEREVAACRIRFGLGGPFCLMVSRLEPRKGHALVIGALATLPRAARPTVAIAGTGRHREHLRSLSAELDVGESVKFLGHVSQSDLTCLYLASELFVMPTRQPGPGDWDFEGFGLVYAEAIAAGTPVLATDAGGTADAVRGAGGGVALVPADIACAEFAQTLCDAMTWKQSGNVPDSSSPASWRDVANEYFDLFVDGGARLAPPSKC